MIQHNTGEPVFLNTGGVVVRGGGLTAGDDEKVHLSKRPGPSQPEF